MFFRVGQKIFNSDNLVDADAFFAALPVYSPVLEES